MRAEYIDGTSGGVKIARTAFPQVRAYFLGTL